MTTWLLAAWLVSGASVQLEADSLLALRVNKDEGTLLSGYSHNHVIRATRFESQISLDRESGRCEVRVTVPVKALEVDAPKMRERFGLTGELDDDDRAEIRENMLDEDQLYAARFPTIRLQTEACTLSDESLALTARLTLRGKTRVVKTQLRREARGGRTALIGQLELKATDFGFEPYSAGLGSLKNRDEMTLHLELFVALPP